MLLVSVQKCNSNKVDGCHRFFTHHLVLLVAGTVGNLQICACVTLPLSNKELTEMLPPLYLSNQFSVLAPNDKVNVDHNC
jgi:hypothetical protein